MSSLLSRSFVSPLQALETKIPAPVVAIAIGLVMKALAVKAGISIDPTALRMHLGIALSQLSAVLALAAMATMWRARTTINPLDPGQARQLVTGGVYRFSRNPMYLSLVLLLVAYAVRLDSWAMWLAPLAFVAYVTRFQILPEERILGSKFGDPYQTYRQRVRRWV